MKITAKEAKDWARKYYFEEIMNAAQRGATKVCFGLEVMAFIDDLKEQGHQVTFVTEPDRPLKKDEVFEPFYLVQW